MWKSIHTPAYAKLRATLVDARNQAGLSQRQLAAKLDVPNSIIAKIESGERRIDPLEFCWLIRACDGDPIEAYRKVCEAVGDAPARHLRRCKRS